MVHVMGAVLREVIIDCNDPGRVAGFWGAVLGWEIHQQEGMFWMSESGKPFPDLRPVSTWDKTTNRGWCSRTRRATSSVFSGDGPMWSDVDGVGVATRARGVAE
jgi:hypothetical protein